MQVIEAAGGEVVADTCAVVAPMRMLDVRSMATNAGKMACYAPMHSGVRMRFGDLEACLDAAVTGSGGRQRVRGDVCCVTGEAAFGSTAWWRRCLRLARLFWRDGRFLRRVRCGVECGLKSTFRCVTGEAAMKTIQMTIDEPLLIEVDRGARRSRPIAPNSFVKRSS